jgi:hypothetical protein
MTQMTQMVSRRGAETLRKHFFVCGETTADKKSAHIAHLLLHTVRYYNVRRVQIVLCAFA